MRNARRAVLEDFDRKPARAKVNNATNPSELESRVLLCCSLRQLLAHFTAVKIPCTFCSDPDLSAIAPNLP
jgi:hypothetical protein